MPPRTEGSATLSSSVTASPLKPLGVGGIKNLLGHGRQGGSQEGSWENTERMQAGE